MEDVKAYLEKGADGVAYGLLAGEASVCSDLKI